MANILDYLKWRGDLPLSAAPAKPADTIWYGEVVSKWYPELSCMDELFPDSVAELRRLIAENPGVTVVVVGNFYNVGALLQSAPDESSPLTGVELVRQNVSSFVLMAGSFANTTKQMTTRRPKSLTPHTQNPKSALPTAGTGQINNICFPLPTGCSIGQPVFLFSLYLPY